MALSPRVPFTLNVLDQSPVPDGFTPGDALRNTIDLARFTEQLGYRRYWLAEHHGTPGLACHSPEVMIGPVASATSRIRVGSGGVMLPHYSPLKVAESFSMLAGLYPDRIDLGIGRAAGTSQRVAHALQRDRRQPPPDDFPDQIAELMEYFEKGNEANPLQRLAVMKFTSPEISLLGSSPQSAIWAAERGLPYVFADFINPAGVEWAAHYRKNFQSSPLLSAPRMSVALWTLCAETDELAMDLSLSWRMSMTMLYRGRPIAVPSVEHAKQFIQVEGVPPEMIPAGRRPIIGTPQRVRAAIEKIAEQYQAEEVFLVNTVHDHAARKRSYELVAEAFGMR
ncbi:MAG: LLM class flavin-dependent oxidoreductase [Bryobacteraceae bacterium]